VQTGMSESLSHEVLPFGIRVLIVEPGAFRTNFLASMVKNKSGSSEAYIDTPVDQTLKYMGGLNGTQRGDAEKSAKRIFEVVMGTGMAAGLELEEGVFLRLPLGADCVVRYERKVEGMKGDFERVREIALSTDLEG